MTAQKILNLLPLVIVAIGAMVGPKCAVAASNAERATAQRLFDAAMQQMQSGEFSGACAKLEESQRLDPALGTQFNLADCYQRMGKLASAWVNFVEVGDLAARRGEHVRERVARDRATQVAPHLSVLSVNVPTPIAGLVVHRDATKLGDAQWGTPVPVDGGQHTITAIAPGHRAWTVKVEVAERDARVTVDVPALAPSADPVSTPRALSIETSGTSSIRGQARPASFTPKPNDQRKAWALVATCVGALGVGIGTVLLFDAANRHQAAKPYCHANVCTDERGTEALADAVHLANWATLPLGLGVAGLGIGAALWLSAPPSYRGNSRLGLGSLPAASSIQFTF